LFDLICFILSITGCLFILIHFCWIRLLRTSLSRLVIFPTLCILIGDLVMFPTFISKETNIYFLRTPALCFTQAAIIQFTVVANFFWSMCISITLIFLVFSPSRDYKKNDVLYHIGCWGISFLIIILTRTHLGDDGDRCRYRNMDDIVRFIINTFLCGSILLFNLVVFGITMKHTVNGNLVAYESTQSLIFTNEKNIATKRVVWRLVFYPIVLVLCSTMVIVLDVYEFTIINIDHSKPSFVYLLDLYRYARGIYLLQGFFYAIIYGRSSKLRNQYKRYAFFRRIFWPELEETI
ncbi:hypothetical protein SAMD00019534_022350, partial [Acytostelium subglobosum LB1]|uniref:hypothetical protein n=1 Tax=Acytostelium subglobosum LB1 TaxID=1410327 RepID=UPI0006449F03